MFSYQIILYIKERSIKTNYLVNILLKNGNIKGIF